MFKRKTVLDGDDIVVRCFVCYLMYERKISADEALRFIGGMVLDFQKYDEEYRRSKTS